MEITAEITIKRDNGNNFKVYCYTGQNSRFSEEGMLIETLALIKSATMLKFYRDKDFDNEGVCRFCHHGSYCGNDCDCEANLCDESVYIEDLKGNK